MSSRETSANSAVTSLVRFLSGAEPQSIDQAFSAAVQDATLTLGDAARVSADRELVSSFFEAIRDRAGHDARVPDRRRASLLARITAAEEALDAGDGPTNAVFTAWNDLQTRFSTWDPSTSVTVIRGSSTDAALSDGAVMTPDGIVITVEDLVAARSAALTAAADHAVYTAGEAFARGSARALERETALAALETAASVMYERLQAEYDATDAGWVALHTDPAAQPGALRHRAWVSRQHAAARLRTTPSRIASSKIQAAATTKDAALVAYRAARAAAETAASAARQTPSPQALTTQAQALKVQRTAFRTYLYTLVIDPVIAPHVTLANLSAAQSWVEMGRAVLTVPRDHLWHAAEMYAADQDTAKVRLGKLAPEEAARRSESRALCRQTILDRERSRHQADPVDRSVTVSQDRKRK